MSKLKKNVQELDQKKESIIKPIIKIDGVKNVIEELYEKSNEDLPIVKAVGIIPIRGTQNFVSFLMKTQGTNVIEIEVSEPNIRAIAEDEAKINFVNTFMSVD